MAFEALTKPTPEEWRNLWLIHEARFKNSPGRDLLTWLYIQKIQMENINKNLQELYGFSLNLDHEGLLSVEPKCESDLQIHDMLLKMAHWMAINLSVYLSKKVRDDLLAEGDTQLAVVVDALVLHAGEYSLPSFVAGLLSVSNDFCRIQAISCLCVWDEVRVSLRGSERLEALLERWKINLRSTPVLRDELPAAFIKGLTSTPLHDMAKMLIEGKLQDYLLQREALDDEESSRVVDLATRALDRFFREEMGPHLGHGE